MTDRSSTERLRVRDLSRFGLNDLAREQGWEMFSEIPGARWSSKEAAERGEKTNFTWPSPKLPETTPKYVYLGIRGSYASNPFNVREYHWYKPHTGPDQPRWVTESKCILQVNDNSPMPTCTFKIPLMTPWAISQTNAKTRLRPEFAKWFKRNQLKFRNLRTGPSTVTLELGSALTPRSLIRGLHYVQEVVKQLPIAEN